MSDSRRDMATPLKDHDNAQKEQDGSHGTKADHVEGVTENIAESAAPKGYQCMIGDREAEKNVESADVMIFEVVQDQDAAHDAVNALLSEEDRTLEEDLMVIINNLPYPKKQR